MAVGGWMDTRIVDRGGRPGIGLSWEGAARPTDDAIGAAIAAAALLAERARPRDLRS